MPYSSFTLAQGLVLAPCDWLVNLLHQSDAGLGTEKVRSELIIPAFRNIL
jgi:hypothetical protein